jgi:dTDP-4-dehydrorhamnose reductase
LDRWNLGRARSGELLSKCGHSTDPLNADSMKVLIIGVTGMLGSALHQVFAPDARFETWGTLRHSSALRFFAERDHARLLHGVDTGDQDALVSTLNRVRPDVVINAVGVIKQLAVANDPLLVLPVNAIFPHRLAGLCDLAGARLIHVSTDCVFSGRRGNYTESDASDAEDLYGKSKHIGEVHDRPHVITLRTSGIGHELNSRHGLLEWFLGESGPVRGYSQAIYTGLPWVELARVIREYVFPRPDLSGLYHVSSDPISKLDLLRIVAKVYCKQIEIQPDDSVRIDRSLDSARFRTGTGYVPAAWPALVAAMHTHRPGAAGRPLVR